MDESYLPDYHYHRLDEITFEDIARWGVKAVALDIDNTICYDSTVRFIGEAEKWIKNMKKKLPVGIVSNADLTRTVYLKRKLKIPGVGMAGKPKAKAFRKGAALMNVKPHEMAIIGDQIFTDVKGGNDAGCVTVFLDKAAEEKLLRRYYKKLRKKEKPYIEEMLKREKEAKK